MWWVFVKNFTEFRFWFSIKVMIKINPKFYERKEAFQMSCSINNEYPPWKLFILPQFCNYYQNFFLTWSNFSCVVLVFNWIRVWIICIQKASLINFFQCLRSFFGNFFLDQFFLRMSSANNKWTGEDRVSEKSIPSMRDPRDFDSLMAQTLRNFEKSLVSTI